MRQSLLLPKLGLTMTEGSVAEWLFQPGQSFNADDVVFVVESDKAATEIPMEAAGTLLEITAEIGDILPVGAVIGYWDDGLPDHTGAHTSAQTSAPAPTAQADTSLSAPTAGTASASTPAPSTVDHADRVPVTPFARKTAAEQGVDLATVQGSGPSGRISARDLPAAPASTVATPVSLRDPATDTAVAAMGSLRDPTPAERTIARKLTASKQEIPHFYLMVEAEVSRLRALREELNAAQTTVRYTLNHFILAAVGRALVENPAANCVWTDAGIVTLRSSDVGMAISAPGGLAAPVLRDVGRRSLAAVAADATAAIGKAKAGRVSAADMQGGAITVSNAGMHHVTYMASIINPGQSMILGVGSVRELFRPDAGGRPELRREIGLTLSVDHRVMGGVGALQLLKNVVRHLERPLGLVLDAASAGT